MEDAVGNPGLQPSKRPSGGASPQPDLRPTEPVRQSARAARQPGARERLSHSSSAPGVALKSQRKALRLRCTVGGCPGHLPRLCSPPASPSSAARPPHLPRLWSLPTLLPLLRDPLTCPGYAACPPPLPLLPDPLTCPDYGACPPPLPLLPDPLGSLRSGGTLTGQLEPSRQAGNCSQQALWLPTTRGLPGLGQSALLPHPVNSRSGCVIKIRFVNSKTQVGVCLFMTTLFYSTTKKAKA